jgi:hypothetical protein
MVPPVRWFHLLSTWIFIISALYPFHRISTFPLNLLALVGILTLKASESFMKSLHIVIIHLTPFLWIPYTVNRESIVLFLGVIFAYLVLMAFLRENPFHVYATLEKEEHTTYKEYLECRFGTTTKI